MSNGMVELKIARCIAPSDVWYWVVEMPNGHVTAVSKIGAHSIEEAVQDAATNGVEAFKRAEAFLAEMEKRNDESVVDIVAASAEAANAEKGGNQE